MALIADEDPGEVPERYRDPERSRQLLSVVSLALAERGFALVPASAWEMQRELRDDGLRVAIFSRETTVEPEAARLAHAVATVGDGQIRIQAGVEPVEHVPLRGSAPPEAQAAAVLASRLVAEAESNDAD